VLVGECLQIIIRFFRHEVAKKRQGNRGNVENNVKILAIAVLIVVHYSPRLFPRARVTLRGGSYWPAWLLVSEVARDGRSVVAVAYGNDLPISLNEHSVSKGFARAECCAYKTAVTECGV